MSECPDCCGLGFDPDRVWEHDEPKPRVSLVEFQRCRTCDGEGTVVLATCMRCEESFPEREIGCEGCCAACQRTVDREAEFIAQGAERREQPNP
jgi:hypothetical protein